MLVGDITCNEYIRQCMYWGTYFDLSKFRWFRQYLRSRRQALVRLDEDDIPDAIYLLKFKKLIENVFGRAKNYKIL